MDTLYHLLATLISNIIVFLNIFYLFLEGAVSNTELSVTPSQLIENHRSFSTHCFPHWSAAKAEVTHKGAN